MPDQTDNALVDALHQGRAKQQAVTFEPDHLDADTALRAHAAVADRFLASGAAVGGWKAGFTSGENRDRLGEHIRPFGFVLEDHVFSSGQRIDSDDLHGSHIEAELSVVLGEPLSGAVSYDQARAAVRAIAPAFEITSRRVPLDHPDLTLMELADGMSGWGIVVGPDIPVQAFETAHVALRCDGSVTAEGTFAGVGLTDPFLSLVHMAATLERYGWSLEPGQRVITGAIAKTPLTPGTWRADFDGLGEVQVTIT